MYDVKATHKRYNNSKKRRESFKKWKENQGALHSALGASPGKKLTATQLKISPTDTELMKKRKQFALNARKWGK